MSEMKEKIQFIMDGGNVVRFHTRPGLVPNTDAHHSHGVAMLCSLLAGSDEEGRTKARVELLMAALTHDLAEQVTGDVSAPAKRLLGFGGEVSATEARILSDYGLNYEALLTKEEGSMLKLADCFDGMLYCCRELSFGNKNVLLIWRRYCEYVHKLCAAGSVSIGLALRASIMFEAVKDIYQEVTSVHGPTFDVFQFE